MTGDVRVGLNSAVLAYRRHPDPVHLALLHGHGLDGIARALEVEATALPGMQRDDATARINGWLRTPQIAGGERDSSAGGDRFGLGGRSPTGGPG